MREVAIIGVGMHKFGKFPDEGLKDLGRVAAWNAIHDANIDAHDIQAAFVGNAAAGLLTGQEMVRGQVILNDAGLFNIPVTNVEGACASALIALREAWVWVGSGMCDVVLALGVEKMYVDDTAKSLAALSAATDMDAVGSIGYQFSGGYAQGIQQNMRRYGWTREDLALVAVKNKYNGSLNPYAQYQKPTTVEEVLNSRVVAYPVTLFMTAPIGDGAAAAIVCPKEMASKFTSKPPIVIKAMAMHSAPFRDYRAPLREPDPNRREVPSLSAREAYETAGIGPDDVDLAEVHDAMTPAELSTYASLGFCKPGEGNILIREGRTSLTGDIPVNTSGGLSARGHPIGATGLAQAAEIVWQLRGEAGPRQIPGKSGKGPRIGLIENNGGTVGQGAAVSTVSIFMRE
jgi:acetyl-CoA acetyltransferase